MTNYRKGWTFENEFVKKLRADEGVLIADRFLKSIGPFWKPDFDNLDRWGNYKPKHAPVDIWWVEKNGRMHFAQLKKGAYGIQTPEMLDLLEFAEFCKGTAEVHLISKKRKYVLVWNLSQIY